MATGPGRLGVRPPPVIKLSSPATSDFWEIPVLFEDEHLLVLDKPSGLLSSPEIGRAHV